MGHLGAVCWQPASLLGFVGPSLGHLRVACWQAGSISVGCQHTALTCSKLSPTRPKRPVANIQPEDAPSLLRPHKICRLPTFNPKMLQARSKRLQKTCGLPTYGAQQAPRNMNSVQQAQYDLWVAKIQLQDAPSSVQYPKRPVGCQRAPRDLQVAHTGPNKPHKTRRNM